MSKRRTIAISLAVLATATLLFFGYQRWTQPDQNPRTELLAQMPADASAVLYFDLDELRQSPFLAELYKWAPQPASDPDYTEFLHSTGFNYETDLQRVSIAVLKHGQDAALFAVADGHFDRKKISAYAMQTGTRENHGGKEIFSVPTPGTARRITFTFLRGDRIALSNDASLETTLSAPRGDPDAQEWRERFRRLAGSPVFAVVRQDAAAGSALNSQAPAGLQSPQLSSLLDQLQWITIAGKAEGDRMRVVLEGESTLEATARQLADLINGLLALAQVGLSEPKMRQQLQPLEREAYLDMLRSADVSRLDRGETKSVRLVFDVTPKFLDAARTSIPAAPAAPENKSRPNKRTIRN
jgi:hypothetical protein